MWIVGAAALLPIGLFFVLWAVASTVVVSYAHRFGVDPDARSSLVEGRRALFLTVIGLFGTGVVRGVLDLEVAGTSPATSFLRGMGQGAAGAAAVLTLLLVVLLVRDRLRSHRR